jgi:NAD(P)-dependent dehydrogenase (short-subunit alcohol dehydrogenase family)
LNGAVAAVLGVGPGLGAAVARRFAREGFAVALMARKEESVAGVREEIEGQGGAALPVTADATDPASVEVTFGRVRDAIGDPEVFVYNAGAFQMGGILEIPPEKFDECFRANCAGTAFNTIRKRSVFTRWFGWPKAVSTSDKEMAPRVLAHPGTRPTERESELWTPTFYARTLPKVAHPLRRHPTAATAVGCTWASRVRMSSASTSRR